jgi:4-hydroxybenzoate polyprenyltransferase
MTLRAALALMRPHQWVKNGFVFVGPIFGHESGGGTLVLHAFALFCAFCAVSSAVYVMNDIFDRRADRAHPKKRMRPIASGAVPVPIAIVLMAMLAAGGFALAAWVSANALVIALAYFVLNVAYSAGLKRIAVLDVFIIAAGFMLRILAGTIGLGIEPSKWLMLCGFMVTLFMGFAKRRAELAEVQTAPPSGPVPSPVQRPSLSGYNLASLDVMVGLTAAAAALAYGLYTVDRTTIELHGTEGLIWTWPFVLYGLLRYLFLLYRRGGGADPAWEVLHDFHLMAAGAGWLAGTWLVLLAPA